MKGKIKGLIVIGIVAASVLLFIKYAAKYLTPMKLAPRSIHGLYSSPDYDPIYKTNLKKNALLRDLEKDGLIVKSGRLNDYDPPWDSLRYLIDNVTCDTQKIEPYIEFDKGKQNGITSFRILWINAAPNETYDTTLYQTLTKKYYDCFEAILRRHEVKY